MNIDELAIPEWLNVEPKNSIDEVQQPVELSQTIRIEAENIGPEKEEITTKIIESPKKQEYINKPEDKKQKNINTENNSEKITL